MTGCDTDGFGTDEATVSEETEPASVGGGDDANAVDADLEAAVAGAAAEIETVADARLTSPPGAPSAERISSVLVGVGGGPHSGATVDLGRRLAERTDAWVDLFHVVSAGDGPVDGPADGSEEPVGDAEDLLLDAARDRLKGFERVDRWIVEGETPGDAIVEQSEYYDAVVVGASTTGTVGRFVFGSTTDTVLEDADVPVVVVEADGSTALMDD